MKKLLEKIYKKLQSENIAEQFASSLSGTEFNSLLLEIFQQKSQTVLPAALLKEFEQNRFVQPDPADPVKSMELDLLCLKQASAAGFKPITLSPVTPFGTCSSVGPVNQKKILSSIRGTEVVSDATNVIMLKIASEFKSQKDKKSLIKYAAVHRHVRAQFFENPDYSAHFSAFCLVSGGYDKGNYTFEFEQLAAHIQLYKVILSQLFESGSLQLRFYLKPGDEHFKSLFNDSIGIWKDWKYTIEEEIENGYYHTIRFKIFVRSGNQFLDIADGGFVDWLSKLTGNMKHRAMISGAGSGLIQKMLSRS